jgi:hypothetical protein
VASLEEDIFTAVKAIWTADSLKWGSAGEGTPQIRGVVRYGSDEQQPLPYARVRVLRPRRLPTCTGTTKWTARVEVRLQFQPGTQMPSENYAGLRDVIVARMVSQLDDAALTASGGTHTFGRCQVLDTPQVREHETIVMLAVDAEGS